MMHLFISIALLKFDLMGMVFLVLDSSYTHMVWSFIKYMKIHVKAVLETKKWYTH